MIAEYPVVLHPVIAKNHEDHTVDWLSFNNIMKMNTREKQFLIAIGMAKDESGMIREYSIFSYIPPLDYLLTPQSLHIYHFLQIELK